MIYCSLFSAAILFLKLTLAMSFWKAVWVSFLKCYNEAKRFIRHFYRTVEIREFQPPARLFPISRKWTSSNLKTQHRALQTDHTKYHKQKITKNITKTRSHKKYHKQELLMHETEISKMITKMYWNNLQFMQNKDNYLGQPSLHLRINYILDKWNQIHYWVVMTCLCLCSTWSWETGEMLMMCAYPQYRKMIDRGGEVKSRNPLSGSGADRSCWGEGRA